MNLIVGLGNPGKKFDCTRHNIGFFAIDALQKLLGTSAWKKSARCQSIISTNQSLILAKPQTFMNESGTAVRLLARYYKIKSQNIWVIYDDIDLAFGSLRIRMNGSAGTHNGMRSIISCLGSNDFPRFRIGIKPLDHEIKDLSRFVLKKFPKKDLAIVNASIENAACAVQTALQKGITSAMNMYNT